MILTGLLSLPRLEGFSLALFRQGLFYLLNSGPLKSSLRREVGRLESVENIRAV